ncbi:MFS transporter [Aquincola sp. J276]|uniref:MFS transporter n=1 Tax=Aquincola sp. J276 TaxID=2898432 RepID=UPI0021512F37|nr:MFS transporter [Aquincola sp. J276]MCR5869133.1 MFS transporter [Aquincola sp. J276]
MFPSTEEPKPRTATVLRLGSAQTLAWASTYYLPAILAAPMARDLGTTVPTVLAAFSLALVVSAAVGPRAGHAIDRLGGRPVLMATSGVFAAGLVGLGLCQGLAGLFMAWVVLGLGMGSGLYEAAFASLVRLYGRQARNGITGITLIAGFASTVGWPLSAWLESRYGWRSTCLVWAALHLLLGLPLNAWLPRVAAVLGRPAPAAAAAPPPAAVPAAADAPAAGGEWRAMLVLAWVFAASLFAATALATHLPRLMQAAGASVGTALMVGALIGPAQVAARLLEFGFLRRAHPLWVARLATALHPLGAALLLLAGPAWAPVFGLMHGAGNGLLTITKGTLPLALFGSAGYGARQGWLMAPARVSQALAPVAFGLVLDRLQGHALWVTAGLGFSAGAALMLLPTQAQPAAAGAQPTLRR